MSLRCFRSAAGLPQVCGEYLESRTAVCRGICQAVICLSLLSGCSSNSGEGSVRFTLWGESYIEQGIPEDEFEDGWSVEFDQFLFVVGKIHVLADSRFSIEQTTLYNLTARGPHEVGTLTTLPEGSYESVGYANPIIGTETALHSSATETDRALMQSGPYSVFVSGTATRSAESKRFAWGFATEVSYTDCTAEIDGKPTPGLVVTSNAIETVELTIHGDHLFYDDLTSPDAKLRFSPIAKADTNQDGQVTLEELEAVPLVDILEGPYGTGSASHVNHLGAFVGSLTQSLGHFRGEGHCQAQVAR